MKIMTVLGVRPQFIKAAAVSRAIRNNYSSIIDEVIVHTGQHFDENMSKVFFDDLDIPKPKYNLEISGGSHGAMTGRMLEAIEVVALTEKPDYVLVYGDTNSTLAGALAAAKLQIPVLHVEAGLRSFNNRMPEELNRIVTDRISSMLFCPSEIATKNLINEGIFDGVYISGDVMYDVALYYKERAIRESNIIQSLGIVTGHYALATCHRAENTDNSLSLENILSALSEISNAIPVVLPLHSRTRGFISKFGLDYLIKNLIVTDPLPFLDMLTLEQSAKVILTDSGGVQKEAFFYGVPCITMRNETEWIETVQLGCNSLVGSQAETIIQEFFSHKSFPSTAPNPYGDGHAASKILSILVNQT